MKQLKIILAVLLVIVNFSNSFCRSIQKHDNSKNQNFSTIWIHSKKTICNINEINKECYLIKNSTSQNKWVSFSGPIIGFNYEEGFEYKIKVATKKIKNHANGSNLKYTLIKIISKIKVSNGLPLSTNWILSSFSDSEEFSQPISKSSFININEKEMKFNGFGACNTISGNLFVSKNKIKFEKIISTRMTCDKIEQENKFIKTLETVTSFKIAGCELYLYNGENKIMTLESCR